MAEGQSLVKLVSADDTVFGVGRVTRFDDVTVNDNGDWLVQTVTDNPDLTIRDVYLRNGLITVRLGTAVPDPPGATIAGFGPNAIDELGNVGWSFSLSGTAGAEFDNTALFFNGRKIAQESFELVATNVSPGTVWKTFKAVQMASDGALSYLLVSGDVDDPAVSATLDDALVVLDVGPAGELAGARVVLKLEDRLPNLPGLIQTITASKTTVAINASGDVVYSISVRASGSDEFLMRNTEIIAREGGGSPVFGRNWKKMIDIDVDINDHGDVAFVGTLNGDTASDLVIVKNNQEVVVQEGEVLPDIAPGAIQNFGSAPVRISNAGDVFWYGDFTGSVDFDTGLFQNKELLIRENTTPYQFALINLISQRPQGFWVSRNGRFVILEGTRQQGGEIVFLMDLGEVAPIPGCATNPGLLRRASGHAVAGGELVLEMDGGQGPGVLPFLMFSGLAPPGYPPCGIMTRQGEVLLGLQDPASLLVFTGIPWVSSPVPFRFSIPNDASLTDLSAICQGFFLDAGDMLPGPQLQLTNALRIVVGRP